LHANNSDQQSPLQKAFSKSFFGGSGQIAISFCYQQNRHIVVDITLEKSSETTT